MPTQSSRLDKCQVGRYTSDSRVVVAALLWKEEQGSTS